MNNDTMLRKYLQLWVKNIRMIQEKMLGWLVKYDGIISEK